MNTIIIIFVGAFLLSFMANIILKFRETELRKKNASLSKKLEDAISRNIEYIKEIEQQKQNPVVIVPSKTPGRYSTSEAKIIAAKELYTNKDLTVEQICGLIGISTPTFYKYIQGTRNKFKETQHAS